TICPINFEMLPWVVQRWEIDDTFSRCSIDHISRITDIDELSISTMLNPSFSLAGVRAGKLSPRHQLRQRNIGNLLRCNTWKATDVEDVNVTIGRVDDI